MSDVIKDDDTDVIAAEFVLGTLDADERTRAKVLLDLDHGFRGMVRMWERRFGELHLMVEPVEPAPQVWERIKLKIADIEPSSEIALPEPLPEPELQRPQELSNGLHNENSPKIGLNLTRFAYDRLNGCNPWQSRRNSIEPMRASRPSFGSATTSAFFALPSCIRTHRLRAFACSTTGRRRSVAARARTPSALSRRVAIDQQHGGGTGDHAGNRDGIEPFVKQHERH